MTKRIRFVTCDELVTVTKRPYSLATTAAMIPSLESRTCNANVRLIGRPRTFSVGWFAIFIWNIKISIKSAEVDLYLMDIRYLIDIICLRQIRSTSGGRGVGSSRQQVGSSQTILVSFSVRHGR